MALVRLIRQAIEALKPVHPHATLSFAQEGEDLVLGRLFAHRPPGFYVDVGAHHPTRFSNTHYFYRRGWRGINIDPRSHFAREFARLRPRDINLNWAVGDPPGERTYYEFNEPALNTFDPALALERRKQSDCRLLSQRQVPIRPLAAVLREHLPAGANVTFLTVDVEGLDLEVLTSNDWSAYRPEAVVVELSAGVTADGLAVDPVAAYLLTRGYRPLCKMVRSAVFVPT